MTEFEINMKKKKLLFLLFNILFLALTNSIAQKPIEITSSEIYAKLQKLGNLGSVLYIAAHPDDENTSVISYFNNYKHFNTTYLSLTRGDGGQNLIGPEIRELLGIIRTQELLAARRIDGGNQVFSRANDFGYSKGPEETFRIWDKDSVLYDIVWAIRCLKPDIIINRFDHRTPGTTHGHHTGSAMLSFEAFDMAGNPDIFPGQLKYTEVWQPKRLFFNTSWWFYGSREKFEEANKDNLTSLDIGAYYPLLGQSNNEISAKSRSQHRCQGFGRLGSRGSEIEYFEFLKGEKPSGDQPFAGINTSWDRINGGSEIQAKIDRIIQSFNFEAPHKIIPDLMNLYQSIKMLDHNPYKEKKLGECKEIIQACTGLFLEAKTNNHKIVPGEEIMIDFELINRSNSNIDVHKIIILPVDKEIEWKEKLPFNRVLSKQISVTLPSNATYTNPYWLNQEGTLGLYSVQDKQLIGMPETPRYLSVQYELEIEGVKILIDRDVVFKSGEPDKGEVYKPLEVIPEYTIEMQNPILFFSEENRKTLNVKVNHHINNDNTDTLLLKLPDGFIAEPTYHLLSGENYQDLFSFEITAPEKEQKQEVLAEIHTKDGNIYSRTMHSISYDHIPEQTVLQPAATTLVRLQIKSTVDKIGYIQGAGDRIPEFLKEIGIQCDLLSLSDIPTTELNQYDAFIFGIRALNTLDGIDNAMPALLEYAKNGGNLILQYNTNRGVKTENFSPYPLTISRDRVTDENSPVKILDPDHQVLNTPNSINESDFKNWVQERGLYFPGTWSDKFDTVIAFKDPGEEYLPSGLLIAPYGKGNYVYTGISWFRELPAGVPGAFKLFVNILSLSTINN